MTRRGKKGTLGVPVPHSTNRKWQPENKLGEGIQETEGHVVVTVICSSQHQHTQEGQSKNKSSEAEVDRLIRASHGRGT